MIVSRWARPKRIRDYIARLVPSVPAGSTDTLNFEYAPTVGGLLALLDRLDPAILSESLSEDDAIEWTAAVAALRQVDQRWSASQTRGSDVTLFRALNRTHPLIVIYNILAKCPDERTPEAEAWLSFIEPEALRRNVARDVDAITRLVRLEEWKAAAVLAGGVVEAVLLAVVERRLASIGTTSSAFARTKGWWADRKRGAELAIENWGLERLIQAASDLDLLDENDKTACRGAQGYRNLIHPGLERLVDDKYEGRALVAVGAVKRLVARFG